MDKSSDSPTLTRRQFLYRLSTVGIYSALTIDALAETGEDPIESLFRETIVVDGVLYSLKRYDTQRTPNGHREIKRQTGIDIATWSIFAERLDDTLQWLQSRRDLRLITTARAIDEAHTAQRFGILLYDQNIRGSGLGGSIGGLETRKAQGLRIFQIGYSDSTEFGGGDNRKYSKLPLNQFGMEVVRELNRLRMIVDVSHTGRQTALDVTQVSSAPVVATHCSARALTKHQRAKHDDVLREIAATGGVIGVMNVAKMIQRESDVVTVDDYVAHIDHMVQTVGIDHVGFASDCWLDGSGVDDKKFGKLDNFLASPERWKHVVRRLQRLGYSRDALQKLMGLNFRRVFQQILDP